MTTLKRRKVGKTKLEVTELGLGGAPMGGFRATISDAEAVKLFLELVHTASALLGAGSEAAKDGRFDCDERKALEPLLLALMKATGELLQAVRS